MPLFIKLDFGYDGDIHAWVNRDICDWSECLSEANGSSPSACLNNLARKMGTLENQKLRNSNIRPPEVVK